MSITIAHITDLSSPLKQNSSTYELHTYYNQKIIRDINKVPGLKYHHVKECVDDLTLAESHALELILRRSLRLAAIFYSNEMLAAIGQCSIRTIQYLKKKLYKYGLFYKIEHQARTSNNYAFHPVFVKCFSSILRYLRQRIKCISGEFAYISKNILGRLRIKRDSSSLSLVYFNKQSSPHLLSPPKIGGEGTLLQNRDGGVGPATLSDEPRIALKGKTNELDSHSNADDIFSIVLTDQEREAVRGYDFSVQQYALRETRRYWDKIVDAKSYFLSVLARYSKRRIVAPAAAPSPVSRITPEQRAVDIIRTTVPFSESKVSREWTGHTEPSGLKARFLSSPQNEDLRIRLNKCKDELAIEEARLADPEKYNYVVISDKRIQLMPMERFVQNRQYAIDKQKVEIARLETQLLSSGVRHGN